MDYERFKEIALEEGTDEGLLEFVWKANPIYQKDGASEEDMRTNTRKWIESGVHDLAVQAKELLDSHREAREILGEEEFKAILMEEGLSKRQADDGWNQCPLWYLSGGCPSDLLREGIRHFLSDFQEEEVKYQEEARRGL